MQSVAEHAGLRSARRRSHEHGYLGGEIKKFEDFFIYPNVWSAFGYIGIPPGCALVGSYENVAKRIQEYQDMAFPCFSWPGIRIWKKPIAWASMSCLC
ncbi:MAG: hypothetical protein ACAH05_08760 [Methylophilus sp.]|nr:hypothetical protein [Methylophilus sp.]